MAPRASWKGFLTVGALSCAVGLYAAASTSERISLHMVSRKSGHRLRRQYVDEETGQPVETDDQVRGYEVSKGEYVTIAPEEAAAVLPDNDKTISIDAFLPCDGIDTVYLDRPYFLAPVDEAAAEVFDLLRRGMAAQKVAALGEALLFRRVRKLLIRPAGEGGALLASTLSFDYEVRPAEEAFADVPDVKITAEMRELATHIIKTKAGKFDPDAYQDRYETALAELVRAKMEGKPLPKAAPRKEEKVVDLLAALRASAKATGGSGKTAPAKGKSAKASIEKRAPARKSTRKAG
ncbi:non-homologous end joining protein Ku [Xanthobacter aminoxidans]|uniref:non-homologous end joining protein Ku n=1 Tax=Xanthobacter aminoxidans TaxID=186280 RepID=UPI002022E10B|nr:Ku protein [Xanthobacter aminoxidans]MCL8383000.1 Ku protein [Xanthobacter aminoxidans]